LKDDSGKTITSIDGVNWSDIVFAVISGIESAIGTAKLALASLLGLTDNQSDFYRRLVARLADEIKQTDARQQEIKQRRAELRAAEQAFADYLKNLEL
ncbi:MAG: hypothetical protein J6333_00825, partial [Planctomycetes bacterium]|nr:hypothetical protein [Planctomycetota bacterium]